MKHIMMSLSLHEIREGGENRTISMHWFLGSSLSASWRDGWEESASWSRYCDFSLSWITEICRSSKVIDE